MHDSTRLLIVDDELMNRDMLERRLTRHGYEVAAVASAAEGIDALARTPYDLVLLDIQMPDMNGMEMLRTVRANYTQSELPVIMVTAKGESEDVVEALDLGANDYITKPIDLPVALARIRTQVSRRHAEKTDPITALPTRSVFLSTLTRLFDEQRRQPESLFALLLLDLDRFTHVNDTLGHAAGDALLREVARRLGGSLRSANADGGVMLTRLDADEFAILLPGIHTSAAAATFAARLTRVFAQPFAVGSNEIFSSASVGVAVSGPAYAEPDEMRRDAGTALSRAKHNGRGRYELFEPEMRELSMARVLGEVDLRRALERNELVVHYQPIVELTTGRIASLEALVRWQHPQRGLIAPAEFIPLAEESQLIAQLGLYVFEVVCRQLGRWSRLVPPHRALPRVAVNVSARQLAQDDLAHRLAMLARRHGVSTSQIEIEVTESAVMLDPVQSRTVVIRLRQAGFRVSIDDFGTGYSSLAYLEQLPADTLKIDKSFISSGTGFEGSAGIVRTVLDLARRMNMEVVAEGVETEDQARKLAALDCGHAQGYYFYKPATGDRIARLLTGQEFVTFPETAD